MPADPTPPTADNVSRTDVLAPITAGGPDRPAFDGGRPATNPFSTESLIDNGFLWAFNRMVLHPRGFALGWSESDQSWRLYGDGTEAWSFEQATDIERQQVYEATLSALVDAHGEREPHHD